MAEINVYVGKLQGPVGYFCPCTPIGAISAYNYLGFVYCSECNNNIRGFSGRPLPSLMEQHYG